MTRVLFLVCHERTNGEEMSMARAKTALPVVATVEGPQMEPRGAVSLGAAINFAQRRAEGHGCAGTWFVKDRLGTTRALVTKYARGPVITTPVEAGS